MLNIVNLDKIYLKSCPYCGGEAYIAFFNGRNPYIECMHTKQCKMRPNTFLMSAERLSKQIKAWNMRYEENKHSYSERIKTTVDESITNINVGKHDMEELFKMYQEYMQEKTDLSFNEWAVSRYNNYDE